MKPEFWPSNIMWNDNIKIITQIETYPPYYILSNGTKVKGELKSKPKQKLIKSKKKKNSRRR